MTAHGRGKLACPRNLSSIHRRYRHHRDRDGARSPAVRDGSVLHRLHGLHRNWDSGTANLMTAWAMIGEERPGLLQAYAFCALWQARADRRTG